ncbi:phosphoadenosine phosphosulfate reductase family protein [Rheinheimera sp. MMS21-TC3]|uniref:phosphoadenosine phosphosulfate reductase domain-containing protein n=1 Tax=Rheinheimera sp. MMS21-TC3 TaxID=3072790 RepID=UPI0028C378AD|nr:phosphoadenosine phosphosulfate reductase family protein [Rheinheimera sp. MMS21-TC3]WNO60422.1 phosphoadenosine phosphosulfate reductase family protein [Rheinheimera sp. MMS21-TC3]
MKTNIVSFSGGRTSAYMVHYIEQMRKNGTMKGPVEYIFIDTAAEHPKTYEFVKRCAEHFNINLTLLRSVINPELGIGVTYKIISWEDLKPDLEPWRAMLAKHGTPFNPGGGFCTDRLKSTVSNKYADETFGKNNTVQWIGYRSDEPKRAWGDKAYSMLIKRGYDTESTADLMRECLASDDYEHYLASRFPAGQDLFGSSAGVSILPELVKRIKQTKKIGFRFLLEISDFDKRDILYFWENQPFNLEIDEWSGNCVFCIKKGENKVALAIKDNPVMAQEFIDLINEDTVRDMNRVFPKEVMYRGHQSLESIRATYADISREELIASIRGSHSLDTGSCSESCEPYSDQLELGV